MIQGANVVLYIDDDPDWLHRYRDYLDSLLASHGWSVEAMPGVDEALAYVAEERHCAAVGGIIWDLILPWGEAYTMEETRGGQRTGVLLHRDLRMVLPEVPMLLLTNVADPQLLAQYNQPPLDYVLRKMDTPPEILAQVVKEWFLGAQ